ncbi:hypothetical protein AMATHDRAFT_140728 [Amanita thiersii Skay4041]|uniref:Fungal lipase-type domain-containing protein n=1 Tax=Amanita thiersii Skay4041 TaxID=703135 RepID=A0A2A9NS94_9AGAR|nr:hypothetical protein AMATHDRAFT_140728 [Amanita thiersii Skay4041]
MLIAAFSVLLTFATSVKAAYVTLQSRTETPLSTEELFSWAPYTQFARAAYCPPSKLTNWTCGEACSALPGFEPTLVGGDGNAVQIFFVGFYPAKNTIVVAHQGTDPNQLLPILTDLDLVMTPLDRSLFPGIPLFTLALVHDGFRRAHERTASKILPEVKRLMDAHGTKSLTLVGHSLGGALAELDSLFFALNIPKASIEAVTYGTPRVGNSVFAKLIDDKVPNFRRINNKKDVVPIVPDTSLGFMHPKGEVHIVSPGHAFACSGNENNMDPNCTIAAVPNIFAGNTNDHNGPYEGIRIGTQHCT